MKCKTCQHCKDDPYYIECRHCKWRPDLIDNYLPIEPKEVGEEPDKP